MALPVIPSLTRRTLNAVTCALTLALVILCFRRYLAVYPITCESLLQIALAEFNRLKNVKRMQRSEDKLSNIEEEDGISKEEMMTRHIASVVGYREEPNLFRKCLQSYRGSRGLELMLVGIDGDHDDDMEMVRIVEEVFPASLEKIHIDEPFGPLAVRIARSYIDSKLQDKEFGSSNPTNSYASHTVSKELQEESRRYAFRLVYEKAVAILEDHNVLRIPATGGLRAICLYQPHVCKKDIIYTNMVFSIALGHANYIEYLWSSDSDTLVYPDTLYKTVGGMASDPLIGGSCCHMTIHNKDEGVVAALGSASYWSELAINRGQLAAFDTVECQPGACAAFRLEALEPVILNWYTQTSFGVRMVVNEDRHLTTNLLLNGWKVTFNTQALAATDTPTTLLRWLLQQMRWARGMHIETFQYPKIYTMHHPILFVTAMRNFYVPLLIGFWTIRYVFTGQSVHTFASLDLLIRMIIITSYNSLISEKHNGIRYLFLSQLLYRVSQPGIILWSALTFLEGGWGTHMRKQSEMKRGLWSGLQHLWSVTAVVVWMGFVAAATARSVCVRFAPMFMTQIMLISAVATMGTLFYVLLKGKN